MVRIARTRYLLFDVIYDDLTCNDVNESQTLHSFLLIWIIVSTALNLIDSLVLGVHTSLLLFLQLSNPGQRVALSPADKHCDSCDQSGSDGPDICELDALQS